MPLKGILFISLFSVCAFGALFFPYLGVYGYIADYCIGSANQWWAASFNHLGIRFSFTLAAMIALGMVLQHRKLKYGTRFIQGQEALMLMFLGLVWLFGVLGETTIGRYGSSDSPAVKLTKVFVFCMMMTHVITDKNKLNGLLWVLVIGSLLLGVKAWDMPRRAFIGGRLEGLGGADFSDSNRFGGFMAGMLFIIAQQFMRTGWMGKGLCLLSGVFTANAVILTRSRGALLGIAGGMFMAVLLVPREYRMKVVVGLLIGSLGVFYLIDPQTIERAASITVSSRDRDSSSSSRLEIWEGGIKMMLDKPIFGVGPGNFYQNIGLYQPLHSGRDAHNTIIRCAGELGIPGLILFGLILWNAVRTYRRAIRGTQLLSQKLNSDFMWMSFGCLTCLAAMFTYGMTGTLLYTEYLWWMLAIPICIQRAIENEVAAIDR